MNNPKLTSSIHEKSTLLDAEDHAVYRSRIGGSLYAAITTRLDVDNGVGQSSRFLENPKENHIKIGYSSV